MSLISQRKAQEKKGPESILVYMGLTFIIADVIALILLLIFKWEINLAFMGLVIYFLILASLTIGIAQHLRENNNDLSNFKNWFYGFIFIGIFIAIVLGAYMW